MTQTPEEIKAFADTVDTLRTNLDEMIENLKTLHMKEMKGNALFYYETQSGRPLFATEIRVSDAIAALRGLDTQYGILWAHLMAEMVRASEKKQVDKI